MESPIDPRTERGIPNTPDAISGRSHFWGAICPDDMAYYLSEDGHMWIPLWTRFIDQHVAASCLPEWTGAFPRGGGA